MKRMMVLFAVMAMACRSALPTPNDFPPPPPMTVIIEDFPTAFVTPTVEPRPAVVTQEKMQDAGTFMLILRARLLSGDDVGVSETVRYPISIKINGSQLEIANADSFLENYDSIFSNEFIQVVAAIPEDNLLLLPNGIQFGRGEIWLNLYCVDPACSDTQILITQINP